MTRNEAIDRIREHMAIHKLNEPRAVKITEALNMAIEALKEQQPRVLSYKEVMESDFVFIELYTDERDGVEPEFIRAIPLFISYEQPDFVTQYEICGHGTREEYMNTWRCWTARPTDEQRKAEPWKDGEQE